MTKVDIVPQGGIAVVPRSTFLVNTKSDFSAVFVYFCLLLGGKVYQVDQPDKNKCPPNLSPKHIR